MVSRAGCWGGLAILLLMAAPVHAEEGPPVEINGDRVEYETGRGKVVAEGHVTVVRGDVSLVCDRLEFLRGEQTAIARGHVTLRRPDGTLSGDRMRFDFTTMTGRFLKARMSFPPLYGSAEEIAKVGENHIRMSRGFLTTSDFDDPEFRFVARRVDVFPGDKAVARDVRLQVGRVPVFFLPRFTQDLRDRKPTFLMTPGYDKEWGAFLLTRYRFQLNGALRGTLHLDYRERRDVAEGIDLDYRTRDYGEGLVRLYYMNERRIGAKRIWQERTRPTVERERFKAEWRHKWDIDDRTQAILQYYRLSDADFLKDYFEREFDRDPTPKTYVLLTRVFPSGTLGFRAEGRVNRFVSAVERLPEVSYSLTERALGRTGLFLRNTSAFADLVKKEASPSGVRAKTMRFDTDTTVSYPMKIGFIEVKPFVGGRETYYSRTAAADERSVLRGMFRTGADLSTKFYRIYDVETERFGLHIHRLRHIVSPSLSYRYDHDPTVPAGKLDAYDDVDTLARSHRLTLALENKWQTKQDRRTRDLARVVVDSDFLFKEDPGKGGFNNVNLDVETKPYDWFALYFDGRYDAAAERLAEANVDVYVNDPDGRWYAKLGKRFNVDVDDQLTSELGCTLNRKWSLRVYHRYDLDTGTLKEQQYNVRRDLHTWTLDVNLNQTRGRGTELWLVFTLKAFPDIGFDVGTTFNRRKPGAQAP